MLNVIGVGKLKIKNMYKNIKVCLRHKIFTHFCFLRCKKNFNFVH